MLHIVCHTQVFAFIEKQLHIPSGGQKRHKKFIQIYKYTPISIWWRYYFHLFLLLSFYILGLYFVFVTFILMNHYFLQSCNDYSRNQLFCLILLNILLWICWYCDVPMGIIVSSDLILCMRVRSTLALHPLFARLFCLTQWLSLSTTKYPVC